MTNHMTSCGLLQWTQSNRLPCWVLCLRTRRRELSWRSAAYHAAFALSPNGMVSVLANVARPLLGTKPLIRHSAGPSLPDVSIRHKRPCGASASHCATERMKENAFIELGI